MDYDCVTDYPDRHTCEVVTRCCDQTAACVSLRTSVWTLLQLLHCCKSVALHDTAALSQVGLRPEQVDEVRYRVGPQPRP